MRFFFPPFFSLFSFQCLDIFFFFVCVLSCNFFFSMFRCDFEEKDKSTAKSDYCVMDSSGGGGGAALHCADTAERLSSLLSLLVRVLLMKATRAGKKFATTDNNL